MSRPDRNSEPGGNSLFFMDSSKGSFSCKSTKDRPKECRWFSKVHQHDMAISGNRNVREEIKMDLGL